MSNKSMRKWSSRFREGLECLSDDQHGQASAIITAELMNKVNDLVRSNQRITILMLAVMGGG